MLAGAFSPVYPCHVSTAQMRTKPVGTGPFKFVELKQNESIKVVRNPDYWKPGRPYLDAIEFNIIASRATSALAFVAGEFDMTFSSEIAAPALKDLKTQAPWAHLRAAADQHPGQPAGQPRQAAVRRCAVRQAMVLAIDRESFTDIIGQGTNRIGGTMLPPPEGLLGHARRVPGHRRGLRRRPREARAEGRKIMGELGYSADKPLKIKVSTRNIPTYRDQAVILIDHLKHVFIQAELEPLDTAVWYNRMGRKDYSVGMNVQGVGIDDPDVVFYETYSLRFGAQLHELLQPRDREAVRPAVADVRHRERREARLGDRQAVAGRWRPARDPARSGRHLLAAGNQGHQTVRQLDL